MEASEWGMTLQHPLSRALYVGRIIPIAWMDNPLACDFLTTNSAILSF
jgi:hypothetical protein